jgi:hypothetical protein
MKFIEQNLELLFSSIAFQIAALPSMMSSSILHISTNNSLTISTLEIDGN